MGKMTENTFKILYEYGIKVYKEEFSPDRAANMANKSNPEVAVSSAKHYINWYSRMMNGDFLSWNTNSDLLKYYVSRIISESTEEKAKLAILGARKYAQSKNKTELDQELIQLSRNNNLQLLPLEKREHRESEMIDTNQEKNDVLDEVSVEMTQKAMLDKVKNYISSKGFFYDNNLIENFYLSLKSKPFVILAGTSGTGKTRLVRLFAEAIGATSSEDGGNGRYKLISVRPDWSDSTDLFGHTNLQGEFVPGAITDFVNDASKEENLNKPYFLCLDEMNLARVEYYLSDFLSVIETRKRVGGRIKTDEILMDAASAKKYPHLTLPENLYIIGTVNMDETTFPFSKKVLDRANTIEFSYVDLIPTFEEHASEMESLKLDNSFFKTDYIILKQDVSQDEREFVVEVCIELQEINEILQRANAHVGYRVRDEIVFYMLNNRKADLLNQDDAFDNEIMQKVLPRIQGSGDAVKELLEALFKKFAGDYTGLSQDSEWKQMKTFIDNKGCKYQKSAEKICYMMRRYEEDGFTSYWL